MATPDLKHPTLPIIKQHFADAKLLATEFRSQTTLVVTVGILHDVLSFLHADQACSYDFLSDVTCVDYLNYPVPVGAPEGRFGVIYNLVSTVHSNRLFVKVMLLPSLDTSGIDKDPALVLPSACDIWAGAEWREREVFDMFGIRFENHPDLRRILTWETFPSHPLRKDYPLEGRGERVAYKTVRREDA